MAASLTRLRTRRNLIEADELQAVEAVLTAVPGLRKNLVDQVLVQLHRLARSQTGRPFVQMSPDQNALVVNWLLEHSSYKLVAVRLWAECFRHLRYDTQEIIATRNELAEAAKTTPNIVTRVMSELVQFNAITKRREGVHVSYYMNPLVGTVMAGVARDKVLAQAPRLKVVSG